MTWFLWGKSFESILYRIPFEEVQLLREIRDNQLLNTEAGTSFMNTFNDVYYSFSPIISDYERESNLQGSS